MLTSIEKMHFSPTFIEDFKILFKATQPLIVGSDGCESVKLLQDETNKHLFFTISIWESPHHLENYRNSDLFKETWAKVKPHFLSKAEAWSLVQ